MDNTKRHGSNSSSPRGGHSTIARFSGHNKPNYGTIWFAAFSTIPVRLSGNGIGIDQIASKLVGHTYLSSCLQIPVKLVSCTTRKKKSKIYARTRKYGIRQLGRRSSKKAIRARLISIRILFPPPGARHCQTFLTSIYRQRQRGAFHNPSKPSGQCSNCEQTGCQKSVTKRYAANRLYGAGGTPPGGYFAVVDTGGKCSGVCVCVFGYFLLVVPCLFTEITFLVCAKEWC